MKIYSVGTELYCTMQMVGHTDMMMLSGCFLQLGACTRKWDVYLLWQWEFSVWSLVLQRYLCPWYAVSRFSQSAVNHLQVAWCPNTEGHSSNSSDEYWGCSLSFSNDKRTEKLLRVELIFWAYCSCILTLYIQELYCMWHITALFHPDWFAWQQACDDHCCCSLLISRSQ
jgi:hypothetical protein